MQQRWIGQPVLRREDLPLLTGRGTFVDDVQVAAPLHVAFARSPWAHAEIRSVDVSAALAARGVAAALTGAELPDLTEPFAAGITHRLAYYAMAAGRARYAGRARATRPPSPRSSPTSSGCRPTTSRPWTASSAAFARRGS